MSLIQDWLPPSRENYRLILTAWQISYPIIGSIQFLIPWYGMGKTSVVSRFNLPGRLAWFLMEIPGISILLYLVRALPAHLGIPAAELPWQNKVLAGLFAIHYVYRAIMYPLFLQPSMSPIHVAVMSVAIGFQTLNATCLGSWLGGYGPATAAAWDAQVGMGQFVLGIGIFYVGLVGNYLHDEELREVRREKARRDEAARRDGEGAKDGGVHKHYAMPRGMLFRYILYPHYFCEWIEWFGFWMATGWCVPARAFLINEIFVMVPRTISGRKWYAERFGEEEVRKKWTVFPGLL